eukprot:Em0004g1248a
MKRCVVSFYTAAFCAVAFRLSFAQPQRLGNIAELRVTINDTTNDINQLQQQESFGEVQFTLLDDPRQKFSTSQSAIAMKHCWARLRYEETVRRSETWLKNIDICGTCCKGDTMAASNQTGMLLTRSELEWLHSKSGCPQLIPAKPNCSAIPSVNNYRTMDGTCNNLQQPMWGAATTAFRRVLPPYYEDGISTMVGSSQVNPFLPRYPSARYVSSAIILDRSEDETNVTHMLMQWGQFLDHDLSHSPKTSISCNDCLKTSICAPIPVHPSDTAFGLITPKLGRCIPFTRTTPACTEFKGRHEPREQINDITSFIDGSMIYGSDTVTANSLRSFSCGWLRSNDSTSGYMDDLPKVSSGNFVAGNKRVNEHTALTVMHTIWLREHNRIADMLGLVNPTWDDDRLYQESRKIVGAEIQKITYYEFLPALMGQDWYDKLIGSYRGYNPSVNPAISNEFAGAAFRFGHSLIRPSFDRLDEDFQSLPMGNLNLFDAIESSVSSFVSSKGTDSILRGLYASNSRRRDEFMDTVLTTRLFESATSSSGYAPTPGGLDLAALNIQRGRDHGLPPYLVVKDFCQKKYNISSLIKNSNTTRRILEIYGTMETVDLYVGALAEQSLPGSVLGATLACIVAETFVNLRDGDRFYFENPTVFTPEQLNEILTKVSLSRVICDNADSIYRVRQNAFLSTESIDSCDNLPPTMDFSIMSGYCYVSIKGPFISAQRMVVLDPLPYQLGVRIYSRSTAQKNFTYGQIHQVSPISMRSTRTACYQIECPTNNLNTSIMAYSYTYPDPKPTLNPIRPLVNTFLPGSTIGAVDNNVYYSTWTVSVLTSPSGVFPTLQKCLASSTTGISFPVSVPVLLPVIVPRLCEPLSPGCSDAIPSVFKNLTIKNPSVNRCMN